MKQLFLLLIFSIITFTLSSQDTEKYYVSGIPLDSINVEYVRIIGISKSFSHKVNIELDFGQFNSVWKNSDTNLTHMGKKVELNSMIDALNFMVSNGYEFVTAYVIPQNGDQSNYHYLLRKIKRP